MNKNFQRDMRRLWRAKLLFWLTVTVSMVGAVALITNTVNLK